MDPLNIALLSLAGALAVALGLLLRERGRLLSDRAAAIAERAAAASARADLAQRLETREREHAQVDQALDAARAEVARLQALIESSQKHREEEARRLEALTKQFKDTFDALAAKTLDQSSTRFLEQAKRVFQAEQEKARSELDKRAEAVDRLVKPVGEALTKTQEQLQKLEKDRATTQATLAEQLRGIAEVSNNLHAETGKLVQALRKPQVRGRYGEIQLERVAELAGMRDYCDFDTQASFRDRDEARSLLRPDMIVKLPNGRVIAVDAKANIEAYLDALEAETDEQADRHLDRFARHVKDQAKKLGDKNYWSAIEGSPEFVVMFVPGDQFVDAALQREPSLLDMAAEQGVIIASPSTLIGLLRAVHVGWRERRLSEAAHELFDLGRELHDRAAVALGHAARVGEAIEQSMRRYNDFVGSVDGRLMPTLRKFEEAGARSEKQLADLSEAEGAARTMQSLPDAQRPDRSDESPAPSDQNSNRTGAEEVIVSEPDVERADSSLYD